VIRLLPFLLLLLLLLFPVLLLREVVNLIVSILHCGAMAGAGTGKTCLSSCFAFLFGSSLSSSSSPLSIFRCHALPSSCLALLCLLLLLPCLFSAVSLLQHLPNSTSQCEHCVLHQRSLSATYLFLFVLFFSLLHLCFILLHLLHFFSVCRAGRWRKQLRAT